MFQLLVLVPLADAAPLDDPHLAERAEWIDCEAEPGEACEGVHDAFAAGQGYIWLDADCARVGASCPEDYVAYAFAAPFEESTACSCDFKGDISESSVPWPFPDFGVCPIDPNETGGGDQGGNGGDGGDGGDGGENGSGGGGDPTSNAECKTLEEAEADAPPLKKGCEAGEKEEMRCEDTAADPGTECFECWNRCVKDLDIPPGGGPIIEGEI